MTQNLKAMFSSGGLTREGPACEFPHMAGRIHSSLLLQDQQQREQASAAFSL